MKVSAVVGSIVVVGALTHYALFHTVFDLKALQMNMLYSLIQELMLYKFEVSHDAAEATKKTIVLWNINAELITVL